MDKDNRPIEKIYQKKSQLEHILLRPDTYIGSIEMQKDKLWVFNTEEDKLEWREINYVPGLYKIFDEILVNAADNFQRDRKSMTFIKVTIEPEKNRISVTNNGRGIPVEIHKEYDIYVPELIFGHLLTSSNYNDDDKKVTGGRNGYGAKLTNIFSKLFIVETADAKSKKSFKQVYKNNMSHKGSPELSAFKKEEFTCITFEPDLAKFKMSRLDEDIVALMTKRVYDMAGVTPKEVKVYLNDKLIEIKNFSSYIDMYLTSSAEDDKIPPKVYDAPHERWEVAVSLSDGQFQQVSYVNSISTSKGGQHVNYVTDKVVDHVLEVVKKKNKNLNIKAHNVRQHLWIFVNCLIENPTFDSQTKEFMSLKQTAFGSSFELTDKFLKKVIETGIVDHCVSFAKAREELKMTKQLNAGSKKSGRLLGIPKLDDANNAGTKNSQLCTLILTEGDSAKSLAMSGIEIVGRDNFGVFPLRGKLLNVREAKHTQITANEEIQNVIKIMGLQVGKQYEEVKALRYGSIMIMTDQDHDGSHIKGLIINFIHHFWPSLIKMNGFLKEFITPIIKATKGNEVFSFYTIPEYKQWVDSLQGNTKNWHIKYYKGLGTSSAKEAQEYFSEIGKNRIEFTYLGEPDDDAIDLAFNKRKAEDRKVWLANFDPDDGFQDSLYTNLKYEDFINKELILFSISDNQRSIPSVCDGLKPSERKILFACFKKKLKGEIKVVQLSGYVSEHSAYHHGEQSLNSTIVAMAQNFVGSNNINLLMPIGQLGTRNQGGKDAASARYIFTSLNRVTRHIFNENDDPLMDFLVEEGQKIEPHWYLPIIPLLLVNGADGIGTGWSSNIPCFNPREIVANIRNRIDTGKFFEMNPWYKGYKGTIEKSDKKGTYLVTGKYEWKDDLLVITELPIKKWTREYKDHLEKLMGIEVANKDAKEKDKKKKKKNDPEEEDDKKEKSTPIVEDFREYHTNNRVHFEVKLLPDFIEEFKENEARLLKKFKLQTTLTLTNMVCFNHDQKITKYNSVDEILEEFFNLRLDYYTKRKEYMLSYLKRDLEILDNKARFILAVVEDKLILKKKKKVALVTELLKMGFTTMSQINQIKITNKSEQEVIAVNEGAEEENNEEEEERENMPVPAREYDYLLSMPLWSLTIEKVNELLKNKELKAKEIEVLMKTDNKDIWAKDLEDFVNVLEDVEKKEEEDRLCAGKIKKKQPAGFGKGKKRAKAGAKENEVTDDDAEKKGKGKKKGGTGGGNNNTNNNEKKGEQSTVKPTTTVKPPPDKSKPNNANKPPEGKTLATADNPFIIAANNANNANNANTKAEPPKEEDIFKLPFKERIALKNKMTSSQDPDVPRLNPDTANLHLGDFKRKGIIDDEDDLDYLLNSDHKKVVLEKKTEPDKIAKSQKNPAQNNKSNLKKQRRIVDDDDDEDYPSTNVDDAQFKF